MKINNSDINILGAGAFGLSISIEAVKRGYSVCVLDKDIPGKEASIWALGRIDPLLRSSYAPKLNDSKKNNSIGYGKKVISNNTSLDQDVLTKKSYNSLLKFIPELQDITKVDLEYDDRPTLQFLNSSEELNIAKKNSKIWLKQGFKNEIVFKDSNQINSSRYNIGPYGAMLLEGPFFIDSYNYQRSLYLYAKKIGVNFVQGNIIKSVPKSNSVITYTDSGKFSSENLIISLGPWTGEYCNKMGYKVPIIPQKGEILRTTLPISGPFSEHLISNCSLIQKKDGDVWIAATTENCGFDRNPTNKAKNSLLNEAKNMMPDMNTVEIKKQTVCFRPVTFDDMPIVDTLDFEKKIFIAGGGGGSGIMRSKIISEIMLNILDGDNKSMLRGISLNRFKNNK
tara:strand:+ start:20649 stop:21836 length:1188 start_codon:yes stop_codon:yes gene_type:complete